MNINKINGRKKRPETPLDAFMRLNDKESLIKPGDRVMAALSGGADSTALTLLLWEEREKLSISLFACHVHHGIRGEEADRDAAFCEKLCERLKIPFVIKYEDVPSYHAKTGKGMEESARILRYKALADAAEEFGANLTATAHTLNDQAETLLFHIARGSSLSGMTGIKAKRGNLVRPLLYCEKEQVLRFLAKKNQPFVTDSTNETDDYTRNRIRKNIIPECIRINPSFYRAVSRFLETAKNEDDYLSSLARDDKQRALVNKGLPQDKGGGFLLKEEAPFGAYDAKYLCSLHQARRRRVLALLLQDVPGDGESFLKVCEIESLLLNGKNGRREIGAGYEAVLAYGVLRLRQKKEKRDLTKPLHPPIILEEGKNTLWEGKSVSLTPIKWEEYEKIHRKFKKNVLSYDKIIGIVSARSRKAGDTISLTCRNGTRKLKKLLIDEKIPEPTRDHLALLCDREGIIWAEGFGSAKRVRAQKEARLVCITIEGDTHHASGCREDSAK